MPLLARETGIHPEALFSLGADDYPWSVAHVRSRQEKVLARYLVQKGIPFYLPTGAIERRRNGRTLTSHLPLFPGYVFLRAPREQRELVWRSNVIANLIDVSDHVQLGDELEQIRRLQLSGASFQLYNELFPGDPVRIAEGVFAGYTGVVMRRKGSERLVVRITLLRQAVSVEFDRAVLHRAR